MSGTSPTPRERAHCGLNRHERLLDALGQAVIAWELDGRITYANRAAAQLFGWPADAMAGLRIDDLLPPLRPVGDDASAITEIARSGESWAGDARFLGHDGESFVAALVQRPLHDDAGQLRGAVAIISDTSEHRQAEIAPRTRDQQLRTLIAHAPVIIWTVDKAGIMTYCEGNGLQNLGLSGGDFVGTSVFAKGDHAPFVGEHHERALAGETFSISSDVGGRNFEVHYGPLRRPRGAITGAMALAIDVTPRREPEPALGDAADLGRDLLDSMGHAVAVVDRDGTIIAVNRGWRCVMAERVPDRPVGDGVGMPYIDACRRADLFSGITAERLRRGIAGVLGGREEPFHSEYVQPGRGDAEPEQWMLLTAEPLSPERGGAIIAHTDVAGQRRNTDIERQLRAATSDVRTRRDQLAHAAHELRSPLSVSRGYLSTITEYHERLAEEEIVDLVKRSQAAVAQLDKLVNDLLLLSKLDAGVLPRSARSVPLHALVAETIGQMRIAHADREFVFRSNAGDARVRGDRHQLRDVVANLLDNAVKYSPEATPIEIDIATSGDGAVSVTIRDRGPGVPAAELDRMFSRFHRVRTAGNATVAGAGIGLAVCRALVERHRGHIEASAPPGGGLAVTFTLPLSARKPRR